EDTASVHVDQAVEVVVGVLLEEDAPTGRCNPRVVEHDVESPERVDRGTDRSVDIVRTSDVAGHGNGATHRVLDLTDRLLRPFGAEVGAHDAGAVAREQQGAGAA